MSIKNQLLSIKKIVRLPKNYPTLQTLFTPLNSFRIQQGEL